MAPWAKITCIDTNHFAAAWQFNPGDCYLYEYDAGDTMDASLDYYYGYYTPSYGTTPMVLNTLDNTYGSSGYFLELNAAGNAFVDVLDAYIGLRFDINGNTHYGWICIDIEEKIIQKNS